MCSAFRVRDLGLDLRIPEGNPANKTSDSVQAQEYVNVMICHRTSPLPCGAQGESERPFFSRSGRAVPLGPGVNYFAVGLIYLYSIPVKEG